MFAQEQVFNVDGLKKFWWLTHLKKIDSAVIETNPDALTIADQLDQERAQGKVRKIF